MSPWDYAALDISRVFDRPLTRNDIQGLSEQDHQRIQTDPVLKPWSRSPLESAAIIVSLLQFAYNEDLEEIEESRLRWILKQAVLWAQIWQEAAKRQIALDAFNEIQKTQQQHFEMPLPNTEGHMRRDLVPPSEAEMDLLRMIGSQAVEALVEEDSFVALDSRHIGSSTLEQDHVMNYRPDPMPSKAKSEDENGIAYFDEEEVTPPAPNPLNQDVRPGPRRKIR